MASQGLDTPTKCRDCGEELKLSRIPKFCPQCGTPNPLGLSGGQQGSATGLSTSTLRGSTTTASASEGYWTGTNVGTPSSTSVPATRGESLPSLTSLLNQPTSVDLPSRDPISALDAPTTNLNEASRESSGRQPSSVGLRRPPTSVQDTSAANVTGGLRPTALSSTNADADIHQAAPFSLEAKIQPLSEHLTDEGRGVISVAGAGASRESGEIRQPTSVEQPSRQPISAQDTSTVKLIGASRESLGRQPSSADPRTGQPITVQDTSTVHSAGGLREIARAANECGTDVQQAATGSLENKMQPLSEHPPQRGRGVTAAGSSGTSPSTPSRLSVAGRVAQSVSHSTIGLQVNDSSSTFLERASARETFPAVRPPGSSVGSGRSAADLSSSGRLFTDPRDVTLTTDAESGRDDSASTRATVAAHSVADSTSTHATGAAHSVADSASTHATGTAHSVADSTSTHATGTAHSVADSTSTHATGTAHSVAVSTSSSATETTLSSLSEDTASGPSSRLLSDAEQFQPLTLTVPVKGHLNAESSRDDSASTFATVTARSVADSASTHATGTAHFVADSTSSPATGMAHSVANSTAGQPAMDLLGYTQSVPGSTLPPVRPVENSEAVLRSVTDADMSSNYASRHDVPSTVPGLNFRQSSILRGHRGPAFTSEMANQERNVITFCVTVASSFRLDPYKDRPLINLLSGKSQLKEEYYLHYKRLLSDRDMWCVDIPVEKLQSSDVTYRYAISQDTSKIGEWLYNVRDEGDVCGRSICFAANHGDTDHDGKRTPLRYQFGVIMLPPMAAEQDQRLLREEVSLGLLHMLPDPYYCLTHRIAADDVLYTFDSVINCIVNSKMFFHRNQQLDEVHLSEVLERYFKDQMKLVEELRKEAFHSDYVLYTVAVFILLMEVSKARKYLRTTDYVIHLCSLVSPLGPRREQLFRIVERVFYTQRAGVYGELLDLMMDVAENGSVQWLILVPFFPEEPEDVGPFRTFFKGSVDEKYLGERIDECITTFQSYKKQDFDVNRWYSILCDTFEMSYRTGHAVVAVCNQEQLRSALAAQLELPIDCCLAAYFKLEPFMRNLEHRLEILRCIGGLVEKLMEKKPTSRYIARQLRLAYFRMPTLSTSSLQSISIDHWHCVTQLSKLMALLQKAVHRVMAASDLELSQYSLRPEGTSVPYEKWVQCVQQWLNKALPVIQASEAATRVDCSARLQELQMWEALLDITWLREPLHMQGTVEYWHEELLKILCDRLQKLSDVERVDLFCLHNFGNQLLKQEFSRIAFAASDAVFKNDSCDYYSERFKEEQSLKKFGDLISASFSKIWPSNSDELTNLDAVLAWPPFLTVIKLYCSSPADTLHESVRQQADLCIQVLEQLCSNLTDFPMKKMKYFELAIVVKHKNTVLDWYQLRTKFSMRSTDVPFDILRKFLATREQEKRGFDEVRSNLRIFCTLCKMLDNVSFIAELSKRLEDDEIQQKPVASLWLAQDPRESAIASPEWLHFPITKTTWLSPDVLKQISSLQESLLFIFFWRRAADAHQGISAKPNAAPERNYADVKKIWDKSFERIQKFVELLKNTETIGSSAIKGGNAATFSDCEIFLAAVGSEDPKRIEAEVRRSVSDHTTSYKVAPHITNLPNLQTAIAKRICNYSQLKLCTQAAAVMKNLVYKLGLKGDFSELELIINLANDQELPLSVVTEELVAHGKMLSSLAEPEKLDCLTAFHDCMELIAWVRKHIKGGVTEVQVFVELASISTKDDSYDAPRVPVLLEALTGYAPLIYDLPEDTGLQGFLEACDRLWKNVESNRELPTHLRSINSCMEWLKEIREAHGEVERSTLQQASAINNRGKYILFNDDKPPRLGDLIRLELYNEPKMEEGESMAPRRISYEEISDLHNKVMLVAGRVELESPRVEKFVKMYESVLRLAEAYIKIHQSGHVWFRYFKVTFAPSPYSSEDDLRGKVDVNISLNSYSHCRIEVQESVPDCAEKAHAIADAIEECLIEWTKYVDDCRRRICELNLFTISQLSYLQVEFAKLTRSRKHNDSSSMHHVMQGDTSPRIFPEQVIHMLALLRRCTKSDIESAFDAIDKISVEDTSMSRSSCDIRLGSMTFKEQDLMSEAVLSLEYVGKVLQHLSPKVEQPRLREDCPNAPPAGKPILIVCHNRDIYATVISLYCDHFLPKPTRNEVLVCHESTSQEEVDLFLKRTFHDYNGLYCLIHADRLNYDICRFFGQRTKEDSLNTKVNYHLFVLCTKKKSQMATILEQKEITIHPKPTRDLRDWLLREEKTFFQPSFALLSKRAGMGKTLSIKRLVELEEAEAEEKGKTQFVSVQLLEQAVDVNAIVEKLHKTGHHNRRIIHINVTQEVRFGVDELLFDLIILGSLAAENGKVWQRLAYDRYIVESLLVDSEAEANSRHTWNAAHPSVELLRSVAFEGPKDCLRIYIDKPAVVIQDFASVWSSDDAERTAHILDKDELMSGTWQRAFQYLRMYQKPSYNVNLNKPEKNMVDMLSMLLTHCGIDDPSWSELHHFVLFLSSQLKDYETSIFCNSSITGELPGFSSFVMRFLLQMSKDFATRSLHISEVSFQSDSSSTISAPGERYLAGMTWKRRWEHNHYPYLFFNSDHTTLTFFDFCIERRTGNLLKPGTREVIEEQVMTPGLYDALEERGVNLSDDVSGRMRSEKVKLTPRQEKLSKLIAVMGQRGFGDQLFDPDPNYELTKDNVKKMLAIHMRIRCGIPVIIMGETGCGKTSLIRFMCNLQVPHKDGSVIENLILMKVHGGVTMEHVIEKVKCAYKLAEKNVKDHPGIDTVLFFDEANTTSAIGLIKEVLCDGTINGESFLRPFSEVRLRIVAAVNPYRKHSEKMIARLERAGFGYTVKADDTEDVLGSVPLRHLVYRVRPLPQSMLPLVWDFGQLRAADEERYIIQFVERHVTRWPLPDGQNHNDWKSAVAKVLVKCQEFMRNQKEECSFVSLRDIDRTLDVMDWFISKASLFRKQYEEAAGAQGSVRSGVLDKITWSLVLALGVCYHACLQPRSRLYFRYSVASCFRKPLVLPDGEKQILREIERCQDTVINSLTGIPDNICRNNALKENIFMMVVCIELRIPLFLVGKPGSSKSLSKSLVTSAMQGKNSTSDFFKGLKQAMVTSFQCSPLVKSEAIINVFKVCAGYQQTSGTEKLVGVVVLDEVGLAEDAKHMPLKALHPLLEDGGDIFELPPNDRKVSGPPQNFKKCAFVGISNWALDPAKMNRGIVVQRGIPTKKELEDTAMGICESSKFGSEALKTLVSDLTAIYLRVFHECSRQQEFFGLRDFYSLMKMLAHFADEQSGKPTPSQCLHAILRNFGGLDDNKVIQLFKKEFKYISDADGSCPPCDPIGLISSALRCVGAKSSIDARYLLLLAENDAALSLVKDILDRNEPEIIFGSEFPKDHHLVQVCRDINRIKTCMEAGKTVVLLKLDRLYESLYDALNQYYTRFGGANFIDLGIGMQRIKCRVHTDFRLIVIADKSHAYEHFPIALKNRLEKHYIKLETLLKPDQLRIVEKLQSWAENFADKIPDNLMNESAKVGVAPKTFESAFVGYSEDTLAAIVMQISDEVNGQISDDGNQPKKPDSAEILKRAQYMLLLSATPGAVIRAKRHFLPNDYKSVYTTYFDEQRHDSLHACLKQLIAKASEDLFLQVTTHYKLLSPDNFDVIKKEMPECSFEETSTLQAFETERQFSKHVRSFFERKEVKTSVLIIQCEAGDRHTELLACARYIIKREYQSKSCNDAAANVSPPKTCRFVVVLLIQLNNFARVPGFHGSRWINVHVDDLRPPMVSLLETMRAETQTIGKLLLSAFEKKGISGQDAEHAPKKSDVYAVLKGCIHEALSRLEEPKSRDSKSGSTFHRRLTVLNDIFKDDKDSSYASFKEAFAKHLAKLMVKKDEDEGEGHWLHDEAALPVNVTKHCTFRRSVEQSVKNRIVPAFAAIVAYTDYYSNLLLFSEHRKEWIGELWLQLFDSDNFFFKHFSTVMLDLITTDQKLKVHVIGRGLEEQRFQTKFPFSWILREELDSQLKSADNGCNDLSIALRSFMSKHPFEEWAVKNPHHRQEAVNMYVDDLLETWSGSSTSEFIEVGQRLIKSEISNSKGDHIDVVHRLFVSDWPKYEKIHELFECVDDEQNREKCVQSFKSKTSFSEIMVCIMEQLMNDLRPSRSRDEINKWRPRIDHCFCVTYDLFEDYQDLESLTDLRKHWKKILSASLLYDALTAAKLSVEEVSNHVCRFFNELTGRDLTTCDGMEQLNQCLLALDNKWESLPRRDLSRLLMYIMSDVVLVSRGKEQDDLVEYIFKNAVKPVNSSGGKDNLMRSPASIASSSADSQSSAQPVWQTVPFYLYCLFKRTSARVAEKLCQVFLGSDGVDDKYTQIYISFLELCFRELKAGLPDVKDNFEVLAPDTAVRHIAVLRANCTSGSLTCNDNKRITDLVRKLCPHKSKHKERWLHKYIEKQGDNVGMNLLRRCDNPASGCIVCQQSMWEDSCIPSVKLFTGDVNFDKIGFANVKPPEALKIIMQHREKIETLRYLYDIVDLSVTLHRKFNWKLNEQNVYAMTASDFVRKYAESQLTRHFEAFICAWNAVCESLKRHKFFYKNQERTVPAGMCQKISIDSLMTTFIFAPADGNTCPLALATYLAELQNTILGKLNSILRPAKKVDLLKMKRSHAIVLTDDNDLLPVILSHYFLPQSQPNTCAEYLYDYSPIEERLVNILIRRAPQLVIPGENCSGDTVELPVFHFHVLCLTAELVMKIDITQTSLDVHVKEEIRKLCRVDVSDLRDACDFVEKGIAFLQYPPANFGVDTPLKQYMTELNVFTNALMDQIMKNCHLRHVRSLWLLLTFELSMALAWKKQKCFDSVDQSYKNSLDSIVDVKDSLRKTLKEEQRPVLDCLLKHLHDYIMLKLATAERRTEQDCNPNETLFRKLHKYSIGEELPDVGMLTFLENLSKDFNDITLKYCVHVWLLIFEVWRCET